MLKKRVIPSLLLKNGRMVKGINFDNFRETGEAKSAIRIYSSQDADELLFIDIDPNPQSRLSLIDIVAHAAKECFMPLTVGGGIKTLNDIKELLAAGADKILINSHAYGNNDFIIDAIDLFGAQCIVAGIDYKGSAESAICWRNSGRECLDISPYMLAQKYDSLGVGEIFLNSIDRDGLKNGYDVQTIKQIADLVSCPLIGAGGAGNFEHLEAAFKNSSVSALSCASLFHFGDNNPIRARSYLRNASVPVRRLREEL